MNFVKIIFADDFRESFNWVEDLKANIERSSHFGGKYFGLGNNNVENVIVLIGI